MNETKKMNFRIEDAITEAYEQMNEAHCGTDRKNEAKLYHKDFSSAMAQAYDHAKNKLGVTIDPKEIDSKVAQGPKKPSRGKTSRYQLKGKGGTVQVQVYNTGKSYELNVYKEGVNEASYTKNTKDSQLKWGREYILNTDANNSVTPMLTQMKNAMKRASMRHPKLGAGTEVKTKKGSILIVPETAELYLKSRDRLPTPLQKNMDKMAERSIDGLFTVLQAALNDLRTGMIESMTEVLENINTEAKFSKDFDKEAKEKGPHQDSSVYKQMRDIIKTQGFANVKTDKGSLKVDMQSAYAWLVSYHMLSDKNKETLIKMAQKSKDSLATTIRVAHKLTVRR